MSKKLTVFAAAHALESFTVAKLSSKAGVPASTVHTVLNRSPENWFKRSLVQSGLRGGQPVQYELSEEGRDAIHQMLQAVSVLPSLVPEHPIPEEPLGLTLARTALAKLTTAPPETAVGLVEDASGNLKWAEAEIVDGAYAGQAQELLAQISELRRQVWPYRGGLPRAVRAAAPLHEWPISSNVGRVRLPTAFPWPDFLSPDVHRVETLAMGPPKAHRVFISYIHDDVDTLVLAGFAKGALASAHRDSGLLLDVVVGHMVAGHRFAEAFHKIAKKMAASTELILCVNSAMNPSEVRIALQVLCESEVLRSAVVLDHSSNAEVQQFAQRCQISYEPNAAESSDVNWVVNAMNGFNAHM